MTNEFSKLIGKLIANNIKFVAIKNETSGVYFIISTRKKCRWLFRDAEVESALLLDFISSNSSSYGFNFTSDEILKVILQIEK